MKKIICTILILLIVTICYNALKQSNYHPDALKGFAIVNKSFNRDLKISLRQYKSYEEFVKPKNIPFYMVIPQNEFELFNKEFSKAQASGEIKKLPNFITEEEVLQKCSASVYEKSKTMGGWHVQQLIKLCFGKTGLAKNYLTLDSDTYFTKTMDSNILFEGTSAKTFSRKIYRNNEEKWKDDVNYNNIKIIKDITGDSSNNYNNFVIGFAMWSYEYLSLLENHLQEKHNYDFADAINLASLEMQWYGNFLYANHKDKFYPLDEIFAFITPWDEESLQKCIPTEGDAWQYGVSYQKSEELSSYKNQCGKWETFLKATKRRLYREKSKVSWFFKDIYYDLMGI